MFEWFIKSGHIADFALFFLLFELTYFCVKKSGTERKAIIFNTASGVAMLLALRSALVGGNLIWIPLFLSTSFVMHLIELKFRANN